MFGPDDKAVDRFEKLFRDFSDKQLRMQRGQEQSWRSRILAPMMGKSRREVDRDVFGYGVKPLNMEGVAFQRGLTQMQERRRAYHGAVRKAPDYWSRRIAGYAGLEQIGEQLGFFEGGKKQRMNAIAASQMSSTLSSVIKRRDLVDRRYGKGLRGDVGFGLGMDAASYFSDPSKLGLGASSLARAKRATGMNSKGLQTGRFSQTEMAGLAGKLTSMGEFEGIESSGADPITGKVVNTKATTAAGREDASKRIARQLAKETVLVASNVSDLMEIFGKTKDESLGMLKKMSVGGKMSKVKRSDLVKMQDFMDNVGVTWEVMGKVFEQGNNLSKQLGFSQAQGRGLIMSNMSTMKTFKRSGVFTPGALDAMGGEQRVANQFMTTGVNIAASKEGKRYRAVTAFIKKVRTGGDAGTADKLQKELDAGYAGAGMISADLVQRAAAASGLSADQVGGAGTVDTMISLQQETINAQMGDETVGNKMVMSMIREQKKRGNWAGLDQPGRVKRIATIWKGRYGVDIDAGIVGKLVANSGQVTEALTAKVPKKNQQDIVREVARLNKAHKGHPKAKAAELRAFFEKNNLDEKFDIDMYIDKFLSDDQYSSEALISEDLAKMGPTGEFGTTYEDLKASAGIMDWYAPTWLGGMDPERLKKAKGRSVRKKAGELLKGSYIKTAKSIHGAEGTSEDDKMLMTLYQMDKTGSLTEAQQAKYQSLGGSEAAMQKIRGKISPADVKSARAKALKWGNEEYGESFKYGDLFKKVQDPKKVVDGGKTAESENTVAGVTGGRTLKDIWDLLDDIRGKPGNPLKSGRTGGV